MTTTTRARNFAHQREAARAAHPSARPRPKRPVRGPAPSGFLGLFGVFVVLNLIGLVMVLSASSVTALNHEGSSYYYFERQLLWTVAGAAVMVLMLRFDYRRLRLSAVPLLAVSAALLVVVLVPGVGQSVNGSSRWIGIGSFGIQPSEFAKLAILVFAADLLARRQARIHDTRVTLRPVLVTFSVFAGLIMLQPNLGTTIVIAGMASMGESYRRARILAFLHPWNDPLNTGYQTIQSQVSLASGGLFGVGLGASRAKYGFLPYAHTDFIFAIIGEELGIVGAMLVVA